MHSGNALAVQCEVFNRLTHRTQWLFSSERVGMALRSRQPGDELTIHGPLPELTSVELTSYNPG